MEPTDQYHMTSTTLQTLESARIQAYRSATSMHASQRAHPVSDKRVLATAYRSDYTTEQRARRLKYLANLITQGPHALLRLIDLQSEEQQLNAPSSTETTTWTQLLLQDLKWLTTHTTKTDDAQRKWSTDRWLEHAHDATQLFKNQVQRAKHRAIAASVDNMCTEVWAQDIADLTSQNDTTPLPIPAPTQAYVCYECGHLSATTTEWANHRRLAHGQHNDMDLRAIGGTCLCCHTDFGTRQELLIHLKYRVARCHNYLSSPCTHA